MYIKIISALLCITLLTFTITGCIVVINGESVQGSGNIITQEREVAEFSKVYLRGSGKVFLTPGETQSLEIKTDDNIMPLIETEVRGKKLTISHGNNRLRPTFFEVYITVQKLEGVGISGSGDIVGNDRFVTDMLYVEISGSGDMDLEVKTGLLENKISGSGSLQLSGTAEEYTISVSGSGKMNAYGVDARHVSVQVSGSGSCRISASESLDARISGSGDVYYRGQPKIDARISGSGSLKSRD
ncbi:MAG: DUF2807 domain-containing protein [Deltaproteobacteria bacterium]|nr:DUF2807 domain-containing protein [Deltaproteobacteria bacterium]